MGRLIKERHLRWQNPDGLVGTERFLYFGTLHQAGRTLEQARDDFIARREAKGWKYLGEAREPDEEWRKPDK